MKFQRKVRVALHFIEDNLPAGEEGIYAVVNNAGVRNEDEIFFCCNVFLMLMIFSMLVSTMLMCLILSIFYVDMFDIEYFLC